MEPIEIKILKRLKQLSKNKEKVKKIKPLSLSDIAKEFNTSKQAIAYIAKKHNIPTKGSILIR